MRRYTPIAAVLLCGTLLAAGCGNQAAPRQDRPDPQQEMQMKQTLVQQDVRTTDSLCRNQCSLHFTQLLSGLNQTGTGQAAVQGKLDEMRRRSPHMVQLAWSDARQGSARTVTSGRAAESVARAAKLYEAEAARVLENGKIYHSPTFAVEGKSYFVLAAPSGDRKQLLTGIIRQDVLGKVESQQRRHLSLEHSPAEKRWKIESVDSNTLAPKTIDHPEQNAGTSHYERNEVVVKFRHDPSRTDLDRITAEIGASRVKRLGPTYVFTSRTMEAKSLMRYFQKWNVQYAEPHYIYVPNGPAAGTLESFPTDHQRVTDSDSRMYAVPGRNVKTGGAAEATGRSKLFGLFDWWPNLGGGKQADDGNKAEAAAEPAPVPNDALFSTYQWNLPIIETLQGWSVNRGKQDVVVAVVDTGVDLNHEDLQGQLVEGYNVLNPDAKPMDDVGHGTHVAGIIGAKVNNGAGVAGMTWYNRIMPVKVLDSSGAGSTYAVAQGIIWAADHGAQVINLSLGNYASSEFLHDAIRYAYDRGIVLVAASGNDNTGQPGYPAAYPEVFAVAATDSQNGKAPFSNYGDYVDASAPGVSIASTYMNNQYAALSGTSMACPHVSALAALLRSTNPKLSNTQVMEIMRNTAKDLGTVGPDAEFGSGLIDVVRAVRAASDAK